MVTLLCRFPVVSECTSKLTRSCVLRKLNITTMKEKRKSKDEVDGSKSKRPKTKSASVGSSESKKSKSKSSTSSKAEKKTYPKEVDPLTNKETVGDIEFTEPLPTRNKKGELVFEDTPEFRPNMSPKEVLQAGSFGGTYFRPIKSGVTGKKYGSEVWKELPQEWLEGLDTKRQVCSSTYNERVNTYKVKCGGSLEMWEESGWMHRQDPYGWFQWYCRFYQGRRSADDDRQVGRWLRCAGPTGRWRGNLISKCVKTGCGFDNIGVSPVVRQTLQHWGYRLNEADFNMGAKKFRK